MDIDWAFCLLNQRERMGFPRANYCWNRPSTNVFTAYSGKEGVGMYKRFPNVEAICIEAELKEPERRERCREHKKA
jgi:hypothetical protein